MRSAEQMDGGVGDGHSGRRRENYGEGRFCFPEPVSRYLRGRAIKDGGRDRQPIIWVGALLPCGQRVPSLKLCSTKYSLFFYRRLKNDLRETFGHAPSL